jgi:hypothetical protein
MPALRFVAQRCGYALAVHGSLKTDIDLLAAPWRQTAVSADYLAEQIRLTAESIIGTAQTRAHDPSPTKKPCGRRAWSFYLQPDGVEGPYIDLSVMPNFGQLELKIGSYADYYPNISELKSGKKRKARNG